MFILARGGQTYCRLQFHVGPGGAVELPVEVDYSQPFAASDHAAWEAEYLAKVTEDHMDWLKGGALANDGKFGLHSDSDVLAAAAVPIPSIDRDDPFFYREDYWYDY
jgi:hypothetical protein